jgi:hypothetical protein
MELNQFELLERKIEELIANYSQLRKKHEELLEILARKEGDVERLKGELESAQLERREIIARVQVLLKKVEASGII